MSEAKALKGNFKTEIMSIIYQMHKVKGVYDKIHKVQSIK